MKVGDELHHERVRRGDFLVATVAQGGQIQTEKGLYREPSPALKDLVGSDINGWHGWTHVKSGKTLRQLRGLAAQASDE